MPVEKSKQGQNKQLQTQLVSMTTSMFAENVSQLMNSVPYFKTKKILMIMHHTENSKKTSEEDLFGDFDFQLGGSCKKTITSRNSAEGAVVGAHRRKKNNHSIFSCLLQCLGQPSTKKRNSIHPLPKHSAQQQQHDHSALHERHAAGTYIDCVGLSSFEGAGAGTISTFSAAPTYTGADAARIESLALGLVSAVPESQSAGGEGVDPVRKFLFDPWRFACVTR